MLKRTCTTEKQHKAGTSPVVQGPQFQTSNAGGMGSIPGQETKVPHAAEQPKNKRKETNITLKTHTHKAKEITDIFLPGLK